MSALITDRQREDTWRVFFKLWANKRSDEALLKKWQQIEQEKHGRVEWMDILWDDILEDLRLLGIYQPEMSEEEIRREYMEKARLYDTFVTKPLRRLVESTEVELGTIVPTITLEMNNSSHLLVTLQELAPKMECHY